MTEKHGPRDPALRLLFKSHPWHGVPIGSAAPDRITVYVEMVPTDTVKYELDKDTGLLTVDRPQKYSNVPPSLYGFVPRTLCASAVAALCAERTGRRGLVGDMDPLDICVITEKHIAHGNIVVQAEPVGGLRMLDGNEVDDKIVAVLHGDAVYGAAREISDLPALLLDRLRHYFLTYKQGPDEAHRSCEITDVYGRAEAHEVFTRSRRDYDEAFSALTAARAELEKG
jgi:inorganic pyrophosphatase